MSKKPVILGIESSCDETAVALIRGNKEDEPEILSNVISSQVDIHKEFGGVVPELAARSHIEKIDLIVQRAINEYQEEALLAILPGVALAQLWTLVGGIEGTLRGISILVFISSIFGLNAMLLASMRERRREVFVLRSIGAPSSFVLALLLLESLLIVTVGIGAAVVALFGAIAAVNGFLADQIGVTLSMAIFSEASLIAIGLIYISSILLLSLIHI